MGTFCWHGNQTKQQITIILAILNCPYTSNIYTKLELYCFSGFRGGHLKIHFFFLNLMLPWQPNKMGIGHKMYKLGR